MAAGMPHARARRRCARRAYRPVSRAPVKRREFQAWAPARWPSASRCCGSEASRARVAAQCVQRRKHGKGVGDPELPIALPLRLVKELVSSGLLRKIRIGKGVLDDVGTGLSGDCGLDENDPAVWSPAENIVLQQHGALGGWDDGGKSGAACAQHMCPTRGRPSVEFLRCSEDAVQPQCRV